VYGFAYMNKLGNRSIRSTGHWILFGRRG